MLHGGSITLSRHKGCMGRCLFPVALQSQLLKPYNFLIKQQKEEKNILLQEEIL